ncbi:hypothetical protein J2Z21_008926 [Streptomyces griseochromogenes]|uniref:Peptidoglycan-binding protein n=1 Tax=Streptomyces griseochromogenes TaxID=68214 RepID=A0A1B1B0S1_9ACTN|nr:hypothetical protein [Streptomyces griseochromogenes]ANP52433.1 hypothetical protein AVL59_25445 [Streptomyces griseochromogenes]MBP2055909.1 hypothetical protein [Streptomyces griseochromogenes]
MDRGRCRCAHPQRHRHLGVGDAAPRHSAPATIGHNTAHTDTHAETHADSDNPFPTTDTVQQPVPADAQQNDSRPVTPTRAEADIDADVKADVKADINIDTDAKADIDADIDTDAKADINTDIDADADADIGTALGAQAFDT